MTVSFAVGSAGADREKTTRRITMARTILAVLLSIGMATAWSVASACPMDGKSDCKCKEGESCDCKADCKCKEGGKCDCKGDCKCKEGGKCDCKAESKPGKEHSCGCKGHGEGKCSHAAKAEATPAVPKDSIGNEATCPVSGKKVTVASDTAFSVYKDQTYFFCCPGCKPKFDKEPETFLKKPDAK